MNQFGGKLMSSTITILSIGDRVIGPYGQGRITAIDGQRCEVTYDTTVYGGSHERTETNTSD